VLLYHRAGDDAADGYIHLRRDKRRGRVAARIDRAEQKLTAPDVVQGHQLGGLRGASGGKDEEDDE